MIKVLARINLKPGSWEKAAPLFRELVEETRKEEGCIEYTLFIDSADENKCCMVETWASEEALAAHGKSEHFTRIIPLFGELTDGRGEMTKLREFK